MLFKVLILGFTIALLTVLWIPFESVFAQLLDVSVCDPLGRCKPRPKPTPFPPMCPGGLCPINFTATNVSDPLTITGLTVGIDKDPTVSGIQPFTFALNEFLNVGESFILLIPALDINGNPLEIPDDFSVSVTTEKVEDGTGTESNSPEITASLEPICGEDDEGLFTVEFSATDDTALSSVDATLNGITVEDGQIVELELDDEAEIEFEDGILEIEDSGFSLVVTATDESGNTATEVIIPSFSGLEECEEDDDEEEDEEEDDDDDDD